MVGSQNRYFIELQPCTGLPVPRNLETETRRELANQFVTMMGAWLEEQSLHDLVSTMAITALGQVQITCENEIINHIRNQEVMNVAAIRASSQYADGFGRYGVAR